MSAEAKWMQNQLIIQKLNEQNENTHSNKKIKSNLMNQSSVQKKKIVKLQKKTNNK